jgi:hypothetical protein
MRAVLCLLLCSAATARPAEFDLKRARQWTPRAEYRGHGTLASANARLNKHLSAKQGIALQSCESFSTEGLRDVLRALLPRTSVELKAIYSKADGRGAKYTTVAEMEAHWATSAPAGDVRVRDAHCHEAVMWFVHHLSSQEQANVMKTMVLPMLPLTDHSVEKRTRAVDDHAGKFYDQKITCQNCHVGGIDNLGVPEVKPTTAKQKARRCYTNYKELFGIECGPCDGVAGPYSGDDDDKYFTPTPCEVVSKPEDVPEGERVKPALPPQFSVDVVGGSDRFGRTTNPVKDALPGPIAKLYGQIYGKWFMDVRPDSDLWLLRHDTTYASVTENGFPIPFIKPHVSEIHAQTSKQRSQNCTGPMVSLIHGMPNWMPGGCTCMPDPVGVPDSQNVGPAHGMENMQYMGRIKLPKLEYLNKPIELDHWANWFFHFFMDTNKSAPNYGKAPSRLASAYAGTAVYDNWVFEDPKITDPTVWTRGIPTSPQRVGPSAGKFCMDTQKSAICSDISQTSFPPAPEAAGPQSSEGCAPTPAKADIRSPFFPAMHKVVEAVEQAKAQLQQVLV